MSITMHSASAPIFVTTLGNLSAWLDKAEAHAAAKKFDPAVLLAARLAPDMLQFTTQVQICCDTAKFLMARLAGVDAPKFDDDEKSLADLRARVAATIAFVQSVPADSVKLPCVWTGFISRSAPQLESRLFIIRKAFANISEEIVSPGWITARSTNA